MPRILGVDIPNDKRTVISLRYIYGIGPHLSEQLCERSGIDPAKRADPLPDSIDAKPNARPDGALPAGSRLRGRPPGTAPPLSPERGRRANFGESAWVLS